MSPEEKSKLIKTLRRYANEDLKLAEKNGAMTVCKTKIGNISIDFEGEYFRVRSYKFNIARPEDEAVDHGLMTKRQAVVFIVNNYDVVDKENQPIQVAV